MDGYHASSRIPQMLPAETSHNLISFGGLVMHCSLTINRQSNAFRPPTSAASISQPSPAWRERVYTFLTITLVKQCGAQVQKQVQALQERWNSVEWKVYDPMTGRTFYAGSPEEAQVGFDRHYYYLCKKRAALRSL
jgi:hypothetical protein